MIPQIRELYYYEVDHHLDFSEYPEYQRAFDQAVAACQSGDLPGPMFHLLDTANRISFTHGFRLGLRLARWAGFS